jgi:hypothetical protein
MPACEAIPCHPLPCSGITDPATCDARTDCYAHYSGDLPCNSSGCSNHFVSCEDAPPVCFSRGAGCGGPPCESPTPACPSGFHVAFPSAAQTCCADRCVATMKCAPIGG